MWADSSPADLPAAARAVLPAAVRAVLPLAARAGLPFAARAGLPFTARAGLDMGAGLVALPFPQLPPSDCLWQRLPAQNTTMIIIMASMTMIAVNEGPPSM